MERPLAVAREAKLRMVGENYGTDDISNRVIPRYANGFLEVIKMHVARLTSDKVKPLVTSRVPGVFDGEAHLLSLALEHVANELQLAQAHAQGVRNGMFYPFSMWRCGMLAGKDKTKSSRNPFTKGEFFCQPYSGRDARIDPSCKHLSERTWDAAWRWVDREEAYESGLYYPEVLDRAIKLKDGGRRGSRGDEESIAAGDASHRDALVEKILICDIASRDTQGRWHETTMVGTPDNPEAEFACEPVPFQGPESGPTVLMAFDEVPDEPLPLSVAAQLMGIDYARAKTTAHFIESAHRLRRNHVVDPASVETFARLKRANPFEAIIGNAQGIATFDTSGVMPELVAAMEQINAIWNNASGMSSLQSGRQGIADTATEASILQASSQQQIESMQKQSAGAMRDILSHAAWHMLNDPFVQLPLLKRTEQGLDLHVVYDGQMVEGDWADFRFDIEPFAPLPMDKNSQLARLTQVFQVLPGLVQMATQAGRDPMAVVDTIASIYAVDDLRRLLGGQGASMVGQLVGNMAKPTGMQMLPAAARGTRPMDQRMQDMAATRS